MMMLLWLPGLTQPSIPSDSVTVLSTSGAVAKTSSLLLFYFRMSVGLQTKRNDALTRHAMCLSVAQWLDCVMVKWRLHLTELTVYRGLLDVPDCE